VEGEHLPVRIDFLDVCSAAAQAAVNTRAVTLRQIRALAESSMRSTLDVRFAEVAVSQARLDLEQAENNAAAAQANLSAPPGLYWPMTFDLVDEPVPGVLARTRIGCAGSCGRPGCLASRPGAWKDIRRPRCKIRQQTAALDPRDGRRGGSPVELASRPDRGSTRRSTEPAPRRRYSPSRRRVRSGWPLNVGLETAQQAEIEQA
jgi:hypothetical protein